jgi:hypothetical protein
MLTIRTCIALNNFNPFLPACVLAEDPVLCSPTTSRVSQSMWGFLIGSAPPSPIKSESCAWRDMRFEAGGWQAE